MTPAAEDITAIVAREPGSPLLVFGGPYSNLQATEALRREAERLGIPADRTICTGDVVAYGAEPEETSLLVRNWGCHVVAGNCEEQLAERAVDCGCGFEDGTACDLLAKGWYPFANARVSAGTRDWMAALPKALTFTHWGLRFRIVHGGVDVINRFVFASQGDLLAQEAARAGADVIIAGHAGVPFAQRVGASAGRPVRGGAPAAATAARLWFNPGAVGMPANDGTSDVWYGLVTPRPTEIQFSLHRLAYDFRAAAAGMRRWAYADAYARSLVTGIWPSFDIFPQAEKAATGKRLRPRLVAVPRPSAGTAAAG